MESHYFGSLIDDVCKRIGISKTELRRSIRALALVNQYEDSDYGDQFREAMFPIFREAARNPALKEWIGWNDGENPAKNAEKRELFFSWLSMEPVLESLTRIYQGRDRETQAETIKLLSKVVFTSPFFLAVKRHAAQDMSLDMAHKFFLPDTVLRNGRKIVFLFNCGGKKQYNKIRNFLSDFIFLFKQAGTFLQGADYVVRSAGYLFYMTRMQKVSVPS